MPASRTATLLAAVALAAVPTTASAASKHRSSTGLQAFFTYSVTFQGSGTFSSTHTSDGLTATTDASFRWATPYEHVLVPRVKNPTQTGFPAFKHGAVGTGTWKIVSPNTDDSGCEGAGTLGRTGLPGGGGGIATDGGLTLKRVKGGLQVTALAADGFSTASGGGDGSSACHPADFWHDVILTSGVGQSDGSAPALTGLTKITPKDLKRASFTKTVLMPPSEAPPSDCGSDASNGVTCTQSYSWTGRLTFIKKQTKRARH
ncbi:hypothetical protein AB0L40_20790 [Patulibacter sp. NPDC049589]|uniref:hypothetical protein n=1 Tax=Patulibacter sp. NPDC049589 TaxID=3154731 RepID=UPI00341ADD77